MKKQIYLLNIKLPPNSPGLQRLKAFEEFYGSNGYQVTYLNPPDHFFSQLRLYFYLFLKSPDKLLISMPPFRNWLLLALPFTKQIVDIRDGWSVAMATGYGGTKPPSPIKAKVAQWIETIAFTFCQKVIVCTPGLILYYQSFLPKFLTRKLILVPNGFDRQHQQNMKPLTTESVLHCICAGKFSEYGKDSVKKALTTLAERYHNRKIQLLIVGCDRNENSWLEGFLKDSAINNITIDIKDRLPANELDILIANSDLGISILRNPDYELGTKAFLYISHGIAIFNYFENENSFTRFFNGYLDTSINLETAIHEFSRSKQIYNCGSKILL